MKNKKERDKFTVATESLRESFSAAISHAAMIRDCDRMKAALLDLWARYNEIVDQLAENAKAIQDDNSDKR